jgi:TRAP transporter TAXI family solute receptor
MAVSVVLAPTPVTLATGTPGGVYHPVGNAICRMFNLEGEHQAMPCVAVSSDGSVANIRRVESGDSTFGLSQTDVAYAAFHGEGPFAAAGPDPKLRTLIALYPEAFTVVARADTGVRDFQDLRGKRIGIGTSGAGYTFTRDVVLGFMAGRYRVLSVCWNSGPPNRTRRSVATKSTRLSLKRGIPMG